MCSLRAALGFTAEQLPKMTADMVRSDLALTDTRRRTLCD